MSTSIAKLALHGFTMTLAREGAKFNITCNTIAPIAASRMTATVMPPEILEALKPDYIAPLVGYLVHETTMETGSLFEVGAGYVAKLRRERSKGACFSVEDLMISPTEIEAKWKTITSFHHPDHPSSITETDWVGLLEKSKSLPRSSLGTTKDGILRFDQKVVLVTGAGAGLGKAYAHLFAHLGAYVVVNDVGMTSMGEKAADLVVNEILRKGGQAFPNHNSVMDGAKIIEAIIQKYGRIDVIINNAGILRDKSFAKMSDEEWDQVIHVHLYGSQRVVRAAWPYFLKQNYGRVINTTSAVGLYGNFGQANYASAKAGIIGLSNTLSLEGRKYNILVNTIAPNAGTNMTKTVMPAEMVEMLKPDYISPLVIYLAHERNAHTGGVFECGSGWVAAVRWQRSNGVMFPTNPSFTPELIKQHFGALIQFTQGKATHPTSAQDAFQSIYAHATSSTPSVSSDSRPSENGVLAPTKHSPSSTTTKSGTPKSIDLHRAQQAIFPEHVFKYTEKDVILYALGIGAKRTDLQWVYENDPQFHVLPSFGFIPGFLSMFSVPLAEYLPEFNFMQLLHGEHYMELKKPFVTQGHYTSKAKILDILDKGKGALVIIGIHTYDSQGTLVCYNEGASFIRGLGGFGGKKVSNARRQPDIPFSLPQRPADYSVVEKTQPDQAVVYRLSGDTNPLHIDPQMSSMGGFPVPILHGLCTLGIATKHIYTKYCFHQGTWSPTLFHSIQCRMSSHVLPGETLKTEMWEMGPGKILFQTKLLERNTTVLSHGMVTFHSSTSPSTSLTTPARFKNEGQSETEKEKGGAPFKASKAMFQQLSMVLDSLSPSKKALQLKSINAIFQFQIQDPQGKHPMSFWYVDLKNEGKVSEGQTQQSDVVLTLNETDFLGLATGKLSGQKAFMQGKLKVKGNVMLAMKLDSVFKELNKKSKL
ncbi:hypothetical protein HMI54_006724 [Coelomomyces lativittatus]|nr:hypothetical protein HMI54_006724 [Coelomomyces lativittatus]KAJ1514708.1 hypothetical protein HMI55_004438 [Coelomomyces lativittatus]